MPEVTPTPTHAKVNYDLEHVPLNEIKQALDYNPTTGLFTWKIRRRGGGRRPVMIGGIAGSPIKRGYILICFTDISGQKHFLHAHGLAWLFRTGQCIKPPFEIDHIDGDTSNNRSNNLRIVTRSQNNMNRQPSSTRGICFDVSRNKWMAYIKINKRRINLGRFSDKADAIAARYQAELKYFGKYRRHQGLPA